MSTFETAMKDILTSVYAEAAKLLLLPLIFFLCWNIWDRLDRMEDRWQDLSLKVNTVSTILENLQEKGAILWVPDNGGGPIRTEASIK